MYKVPEKKGYSGMWDRWSKVLFVFYLHIIKLENPKEFCDSIHAKTLQFFSKIGEWTVMIDSKENQEMHQSWGSFILVSCKYEYLIYLSLSFLIKSKEHVTLGIWIHCDGVIILIHMFGCQLE